MPFSSAIFESSLSCLASLYLGQLPYRAEALEFSFSRINVFSVVSIIHQGSLLDPFQALHLRSDDLSSRDLQAYMANSDIGYLS